MEDFTIRETYKLPSLGKVYAKPIKEEITLRSMTINEEMMRLNNNGTWKSICDMLDACIVDEDIGISAYDMCTADFSFLWHRLRVVTYGKTYSISCTCPYCLTQNKFDVDLTALPVTYYNEDILKYQTFTLPVSGKKIKIQMQTPRMLDAIAQREKDLKKQGSNLNQHILLNAMLSIVEVDDVAMDIPTKQILLQTLPMQDINKILQAIEKFNNAIGLSIAVEARCSHCDETFSTSFEQGGNFFRPEAEF